MPSIRGRGKVLMVSLLVATACFSVPVLATQNMHVVRKGDTLYAIARTHGIALADLLSWNNLKQNSVIQPGQEIMLSPPVAATESDDQATTSEQSSPSYTVSQGDTLWAISRETGVALQELMRINGLQADGTIRPGLVLRLSDGPAQTTQPIIFGGVGGVISTPLPGPVQKPAAITARQEKAVVTQREGEAPLTDVSQGPARVTQQVTEVPLAIASDADKGREALERTTNGPESGFAWPVTGRLTSPYGKRWGRMHEGIDLGVPTGTPVRAAADGIVKSAGWSGGYGQLLVIDHGSGWETYYAHNSELRVAKGDAVRKGQVVARSGNTGRTTGPHLHFEIRRDNKPLDPLRFLN
ncbi:MAG: peptidoglycan DD-metalloendopeptidase family protein [Limnochordia bacterium]|jgi:murein DD-endopeptidase MepM/ murein hydrolase activator NlpD